MAYRGTTALLISVLLGTLPMARMPVSFAQEDAPFIPHSNQSWHVPEKASSGNAASSKDFYGNAASNETDDVPTIRSNVTVEKEFQPDVTFQPPETVQTGETMILTVMDILATGYSQQGDEFNARVKVPVQRNGKILVPAGTLVKGHLSEIEDPGKSFSKKGKMVLAFDYLLMPDGRKVPFQSQAVQGDSKIKAVGRAMGGGIGGTIGGAVKGVIVGLKYAGLAAASMTNGATLIGGASIGALAGLGDGLSRSGDHVLLNEGDQIKVVLQSPLKLPGMILANDTQNEVNAPGLGVNVTSYTLSRDPFKVENQINLNIVMDNQTDETFGSLDMVLMDEYKNVFQISPFSNDSMMMFQLPPRSRLNGQFSFSVKAPEVRHYLVFYKPYTRDVMAKISLSEVLRKQALQPAGKPIKTSRKR